MTDRDKNRKTQIQEPAGKPSQAEGDRETVEEALGERPSTTEKQGATDTPAGKPSQAEGDRETVDEDLKEKKS